MDIFEDQMYNLALFHAQQIENLGSLSFPINEPKTQKIYNSLHKEWQKTEIGSPQEKAFEYVMKPYVKALELKRLVKE